MKKIIKLANKALEKSDYTLAIKLYKDALEINPKNLEALVNISHCFIELKIKSEATKYAKLAYDNRDSDSMCAVNYSCVLSDVDLNSAIQILEIEVKKRSKNHLVYNNLGYYNFLLGNYELALLNYNYSIKLEEVNHLAYCNRGNLRFFILNDDCGLSDLKKARKYGDIEAELILSTITSSKLS